MMRSLLFLYLSLTSCIFSMTMDTSGVSSKDTRRDKKRTTRNELRNHVKRAKVAHKDNKRASAYDDLVTQAQQLVEELVDEKSDQNFLALEKRALKIFKALKRMCDNPDFDITSDNDFFLWACVQEDHYDHIIHLFIQHIASQEKAYFLKKEIAVNTYLEEFNRALPRIRGEYIKSEILLAFSKLSPLESPFSKKLFVLLQNRKPSYFDLCTKIKQKIQDVEYFDSIDEKEAPKIHTTIQEFAKKLKLKKQIRVLINPNSYLHDMCIYIHREEAYYLEIGIQKHEAEVWQTTAEYRSSLAHETAHALIRQRKKILDPWDEEFEADRIAEILTSPQDIINSLTKDLQSTKNRNQMPSVFNVNWFQCLGTLEDDEFLAKLWRKTFKKKAAEKEKLFSSQTEKELFLAQELRKNKNHAGSHPPDMLRIQKVQTRRYNLRI